MVVLRPSKAVAPVRFRYPAYTPGWRNPAPIPSGGMVRGKMVYLPRIVGAAMAELAYAGDLKSPGRKALRVRVPLAAPLVQGT